MVNEKYTVFANVNWLFFAVSIILVIYK